MAQLPIEKLQLVWDKLDLYKAEVQNRKNREQLNVVLDRLLKEVLEEIDPSEDTRRYFLGQCQQVDARYYVPEDPTSN